MSDELPIVSHVASPEYRDSVDRMTCAAPGCRRWKVGDGSEYCQEHDWEMRTQDANRVFNHAFLSRGVGFTPSYFDTMRVNHLKGSG